MTLVVDASLAIQAAIVEQLPARVLAEELVAPPLMWSEASSALHQLIWRGEIPRRVAGRLLGNLLALPIDRAEDARLVDAAWRLADTLGWAKTYDAEYLALASLLGCRLVTLDARLRRGADRLGFVVGPPEL